MTIYEEFCRREALRRGIDPDTAVVVANSEGGLTEPAVLGDFSGHPWYSGKSWWAFQLHYGGAEYAGWGGSAGMGNSFTAQTGWQPGDAAAWRDAMRYALDGVRANGWGAWYGAKKYGIVGFMGIDHSVPWSGTPADEWDYLSGADPSEYLEESASGGPALDELLRIGRTFMDVPYLWGGKTPDAFDCSGFVGYVCKQLGVEFSVWFTDTIYGESLPVSDPRPGDICFYRDYPGHDQSNATWGHMGFWLNDQETLDCRDQLGVGVHPHIRSGTMDVRRAPGVRIGGGDMVYKERAERLATAVADIGDRVMDILEGERAKLDDFGAPPDYPAEGAPADAWVAYGQGMKSWGDAVRANTDERYREIGNIGQFIRDTASDVLGRTPQPVGG